MFEYIPTNNSLQKSSHLVDGTFFFNKLFLEKNVYLVDSLGVGNGVSVLDDGHRLPGEDGLINTESRG